MKHSQPHLAWDEQQISGMTIRQYATERRAAGAKPRIIADELSAALGVTVRARMVYDGINKRPTAKRRAWRRHEHSGHRDTVAATHNPLTARRGQGSWRPSCEQEREAFKRLYCTECASVATCDRRAQELSGQWVPPGDNTAGSVFGCRRFVSARARADREKARRSASEVAHG